MKKTLITILLALTLWSSGWISVRIYDSQKRGDILTTGATTEDMLDLINNERIKANVGPVGLDDRLTRAAEAKACEMNKRGYFDHQDPEGRWGWHFLWEQDVMYQYAGENLAKEKIERIPDAQADMLSLMASPEHRSIILDPKYTEVGYASCGIYTVQYFIK